MSHQEMILAVIGDLVEDIVVWGHSTLEPGDDNPSKIRRTRGGSGANVAAAASGLTPVRFIGRVGNDAAGEGLVRNLKTNGIQVCVQTEGSTGTIVILVDQAGERTMFPDRAAASELDKIDASWLDGVSWLHLPFYCFLTDRSRQAAIEACDHVSRKGISISVDLSSVSVLRRLGPQTVRQLLSHIRPAVVFANEAEAIHLGSIAAIIRDGTTYIVKRGPQPVRIYETSGSREVVVPPVDEVIDSTGAGDAFAAGYIASAMKGLPTIECVSKGILIAAGVLASPGAY